MEDGTRSSKQLEEDLKKTDDKVDKLASDMSQLSILMAQLVQQQQKLMEHFQNSAAHVTGPNSSRWKDTADVQGQEQLFTAKDPLRNVHQSMSPVKVDKTNDDDHVSSDLVLPSDLVLAGAMATPRPVTPNSIIDKSYMYGKLPTKVFLVDFSLDLVLQKTQAVEEIDGYKFVVPSCVQSRSSKICSQGVCQKVQETSLLHFDMLGELNEGYGILHAVEELLVIWLHKPPPLPPENVLRTEKYFDARNFLDIVVSCLKDELYPEIVRNRKPKLPLLAVLINLCAKEADIISKVVFVELLRTPYLQDSLLNGIISELEILVIDQFNVFYKPLWVSILGSLRQLSKTSFVGTALGSRFFSSSHGEMDDNDIGGDTRRLTGGATARGVIEYVVLVFFETVPEGLIWWLLKASAEIIWKGMFKMSYKFVLEAEITMKRLKGVILSEKKFRVKIDDVGRVYEQGDQSKPTHRLTMSLDRLKGMVMMSFEIVICGSSFTLDEYFLMRFVNKIFMFSLPRPPEIDDLEDKVDFKGEGMLGIGLLRKLRGSSCI